MNEQKPVPLPITAEGEDVEKATVIASIKLLNMKDGRKLACGQVYTQEQEVSLTSIVLGTFCILDRCLSEEKSVKDRLERIEALRQAFAGFFETRRRENEKTLNV